MKKGWRVIIIIVLVAILLGAVCLAVGLVTGGDPARIYDILDERYHLTMYLDYVRELYRVLSGAVMDGSLFHAFTEALRTPAP